ncbi:MAG: hypothetical protein Q4C48_07240 [Lachnospiraceae bacterium]|nr:hypothetical protein [Lachnospiraceae bacterium]
MNLQEVAARVEEILSALDFNALFEGFHPYRFALYDSREICLDGRRMPYREEFRGNTSIEFEGEFIAIWDYGSDPLEDRELLAYLLVHEMFHCHQNAKHEARWPSDLALLKDPGDVENFTVKYNENLFLADCYERCDMEALKKFTALRDRRSAQYPAAAEQEQKAETIEGMAEYIGLKALRAIAPEKFASAVEQDLKLLRGESALLFDARKLSYYTGALFFLCLEQLGAEVRNDFSDGRTAYAQNRIAGAAPAPEPRQFAFIEREYERQMREKEKRIAEHIARSSYTPCEAWICGYDPMNMFRVEDRLYCSHFVCLNENGSGKAYQTPILLELKHGSDREIRGYYMKTDEECAPERAVGKERNA